MPRHPKASEFAQSIPEMMDELTRQEIATWYNDGKRYKVIYYALEMIPAVGFRVREVRGTQFRQWANAHLSEYLVKGFTPKTRPDLEL